LAGGCTATVAIVVPRRTAQSGAVTVPDGVVVSKLFDPNAPTSIVRTVKLNVVDNSSELGVEVVPERYVPSAVATDELLTLGWVLSSKVNQEHVLGCQ
jgi:hypothetical protein